MTNLVQFPGLGLEFNINRVAFSLGSLDVYWYGLLIGSGLVLALVFAFRYAVDFGIDTDRFIDVVLIGTVCAVVCARLYYVAFSPVPYNSLAEILNLRDGGIAIYGAVIGAAVFGGLACKLRKIPVLATFDLVSMGFLIGQCIGRWGNFTNQEAFGSNTTLPWGMMSENTRSYLTYWQGTLAEQGITVDPNLPVHPTFLYESIWCVVGFFALFAYMKKRHFNGEIALMYVVWYGAGRFWIEGLRTDSLMSSFLGMRVSQVLALVSVVAALVALILLRKKFKNRPLLVEVPVSGEVERKLKKELKKQFPDGTTGFIMSKETLPASAPHSEFAAAQKQSAQFDVEECVKGMLAQQEETAAQMAQEQQATESETAEAQKDEQSEETPE